MDNTRIPTWGKDIFGNEVYIQFILHINLKKERMMKKTGHVI